MNLTKVISAAKDDLSRLVVKVLRMGRSDVQTGIAAQPYGVDSNPIADMVAVYSKTGENGKAVIVGYLNKNQVAGPGELRLFSTDGNGAEVMYAWLRSDGTMELGGDTDFMARFSELKAGFDQLKSDFNSHVNTFNAHVHPGVTAGAGSTAVTATPGTASAASIDAAKIDEIKTI